MKLYIGKPIVFTAERNEGPHAGTVAGKNWPAGHYRMTCVNPTVPMEPFVCSPEQLACYYEPAAEEAPVEGPAEAPAFNVPQGRVATDTDDEEDPDEDTDEIT